MKKLPIIFLIPVILACSVNGKFEDETTRLIADLKDKRKTDSLLFFLRAENPVHRREAALAFGSVQDSAASAALGTALLEDKDTEVRRNAAFALGQTSGNQAVNALIPALEDKERTVVREALEALGKCLTSRDLRALQAYESTDTLLQEGQAWALYRLALRGVTDGSTSKITAHFLAPEFSYQARLAAAHFFGRIASAPPTGFEEKLVESALNDKRSEVRMAAISGMKYVDYRRALPVLTNALNKENDYRVRVNAVKTCQTFVDSAVVKAIVLGSLSDSSEMVQIAASEIVRRFGEKFSRKHLIEPLFNTKSIRARANLHAATLKSSGTDELDEEVKMFLASRNTYAKAHFLSALGDARPPLNQKVFEILSTELLNTSNEKVILTTSAAALVEINRTTDKELSGTEFLEVYKRAIANGDPGVIGIVCAALRDESLHYKELIKDLAFLYEAEAKLTLPKDVESLVPLERAIAYLEGKEYKPTKNAFNHPIDWKLTGTISGDEKAEILTSKGTIVIRFLVEDAPGSVANFVELAKRKYFDGKHVHRVVPNFVVQDGCNRGDGFGSEDYSIRSEFSLKRYGTGSVGMASAGKDTEGTQWFITHSPTPHLDGRYTIFAEVESGMETVHKLGVGDKILEVKVKSK